MYDSKSGKQLTIQNDMRHSLLLARLELLQTGHKPTLHKLRIKT